VKELKDDLGYLFIGQSVEWNPVKELKALFALKQVEQMDRCGIR